MPSTPRILERLPSVYQPEPGYDDDDLLLQIATATGSLLDQLSESSAEVMQAHWFDYADSAVYSNWLGRYRALNGNGPLTLDDPALDQFPYLFDLPRIAAMVDLSPWREPLRDRERVEAFRTRIARIVRLHREGLGTVRALRSMTMIALPQINPDAPEGLRERNFTVEEFSGTQERLQAISQPGLPADQVGPLMRWHINNDSINPATPTIVISGVTPEPGKVDPTDNPIIENFDPATGTGVGIHYQGKLAPGEALAITPGYHSWLGHDGGVDFSGSVPASMESVNPTAAGPWSGADPTLTDSIIDLKQTEDQFLWAAANGEEGSLWRSDGNSWSQILAGLPEIHCLLPHGGELLVGFATGLSRLQIQPTGGFVLEPDPSTLSDPAVHALGIDSSGTLWAATQQGLAQEQGGALVHTLLGNRSETETELRCLWLDQSGDIYCGGERGLFLYRRSQQRWYILLREAVDEAIDDWLELDLTTGTLPGPEAVFVPPVHAVIHGPDTDIWLGTRQGIARYRAREHRRTYTTLLEALPQLTETTVQQITLDARNRLWFATGDGLFIFDQLDWFQRRGDALVRLPRQSEEPEQPVFWRYQRGSSQWQLMTPPSQSGFEDYTSDSLGSHEPAVNTVTWTESAHARLGSFDGKHFTVDASATPAPLAVRYKPEPTRIVDGGIPAVPRLSHGRSHWRYLQREASTPDTPSGNPAWTREGRLLPPPADSSAPHEGRYLGVRAALENSVFAFCPAAKLWFLWRPQAPLTVTVRLTKSEPDEQIDPKILDRVWTELQRVKPAAVAVYLAVDETIARGQ
jgi:hypothetical protein